MGCGTVNVAMGLGMVTLHDLPFYLPLHPATLSSLLWRRRDAEYTCMVHITLGIEGQYTNAQILSNVIYPETCHEPNFWTLVNSSRGKWRQKRWNFQKQDNWSKKVLIRIWLILSRVRIWVTWIVDSRSVTNIYNFVKCKLA